MNLDYFHLAKEDPENRAWHKLRDEICTWHDFRTQFLVSTIFLDAISAYQIP